MGWSTVFSSVFYVYCHAFSRLEFLSLGELFTDPHDACLTPCIGTSGVTMHRRSNLVLLPTLLGLNQPNGMPLSPPYSSSVTVKPPFHLKPLASLFWTTLPSVSEKSCHRHPPGPCFPPTHETDSFSFLLFAKFHNLHKFCKSA